jgi:Ca-activated chloride channel homolog
LQLCPATLGVFLIAKWVTGLVFNAALLAATSFAGEAVTTIHKSISEVRLTVVATDPRGRPITNLSAREFSVLEDGHPIDHFDLRSASDLPLRVGIVLDLSDSMHKSWPILRNSLTQSLQQLLRPEDRMLVLAFDHKIELEKTVTIPQQFNFLEIPQAGGLTALYDTLYFACQKRMLTDASEPRHSALIVFSDGEDNLSRHDLEDVMESAESGGIAIYSVSNHSHRLHKSGDTILHELAMATGGRSFVAATGSELQAALTTIQNELRSSYLLYYRIPEQPGGGKFRRIKLVPTSQGGPSLRSRSGYYISH